MQSLVVSTLLLLSSAQVGEASRQLLRNPGAPGFLGTTHATRTHVAFLDAYADTRNGTAAGASAAATAAVCAMRQKTIFCMAPDNLEEWKEHATCCLAHCGSGGDPCFDGCMRDCVKRPLDCTGLALKNQCFKQCKELGDCNSCLSTVQAGNTAGCTSKCLKTFEAEVKAEKCPLR